MPHGYTNTTLTDGHVVVKTYQGPDSAARQKREEAALGVLAPLLPVPALVSSVPGTSTTSFVDGVPAQEAIAEGGAEEVMRACGSLLTAVQSVDPHLMDGAWQRPGSEGPPRGGGPDAVVVHGDFGPNNIVMSPDLSTAVLLCDWEWVTVGDRDTDLAWAEFIVRMHHPESVSALPVLFEAYGAKPVWPRRQAAMRRRASAHREFVRRWHGPAGDARWTERIAAISAWSEL